MNYESYSKEQLIEKIEEFRLLNHRLLADNEQYLIANENSSESNSLTKLRNIRNLIKHLIMESNRGLILNKPLSIALFELEGFREINNTKGYIYCDMILKDMTRIIQSNVRNTDLVGRYTGEEFMIIFSSTSESVAQSIAQRIQQAIQQHCLEDDISITVTCSIRQEAGESLEAFIEAAETNLCKAKK